MKLCKWNEMNLNFLMYADDLILFSESKDGLQQSLDNLKEYCDKWQLEVNTTKTKTMCINDDKRN